MAPDAGKTLDDLQREHGPAPLHRHRVPPSEAAEHSTLRNYVRDIVLGFNDGLVSVYAIVAGVAGAAFTSGDIVIAGVAATVAGALSMGLGEYLSTKSQAEYYAAEEQREREHIRKFPHLERQEVAEMLAEKGIPEGLIPEITDAITSDEERFVGFMMREEFGVGEESERSPLVAMGLVMAAFVVGAVLPVAPFTLLAPTPGLAAASALSLGGLFLAGAIKAHVSRLNKLRSGGEMMLLGAVAALITYGIGALFGVAA